MGQRLSVLSRINRSFAYSLYAFISRNIMPLIRKEGKDTIIFASKEDHATPSKIDLPKPEPSPGLLLPSGEINWNCPCLGGMATGPCGLEFREAFSCFHYSNADPKGSECYDAFKKMQQCMSEYPGLYGNKDTSMDDLENDLDLMNEDNDEDEKDMRLQMESKETTMEVKVTENKLLPQQGQRQQPLSNEKEVERSKAN